MNTLYLAPGLRLPIEAVTQTFAVLAKRGVGKTYLMLLMAEEMLRCGLMLVIVDPVGVCWGLRSAADGKGPGLAILVMGGDHGDIPLESTSGEVVADFVVAKRHPVVLDLSLMRKGEQVRFMADFSERLYHSNREPLHIMLDEADAFAPQKPMKGQERMLGAVEDLVRRGRARGIGLTMCTQRSAVLNKDVLTQAEVLVAMRTIAPQDRDAVEAWVKVHGTLEQKAELMASLPSLEIGEAWFWSPGWLDIFKRVRVRQRITFDSSATPKAGVKVVTPKRMAPVDLKSLTEAIAASVERAKASDPRALRTKVGELQAEVQRLTAQVAARREPVTRTKVVEVKVHVLTPADRKLLANRAGLFRHTANAIVELVDSAAEFHKLADRLAAALAVKPQTQVPDYRPSPYGPAVDSQLAGKNATFLGPSPFGGRDRPISSPVLRKPEAVPVSGLRKGERRMLEALARRYPLVLTKAQLATLAGFSVRGGTFNTYYSVLKRGGFIAEESYGRIAITDAGLAVAPAQDGEMNTAQTIAMWMGALRAGERKMLQYLVDIYPQTVTKDTLARATNFSGNGGTFNTYLSVLRRNGLIVQERDMLCASQTLFA